jgi:hypothetical protein
MSRNGELQHSVFRLSLIGERNSMMQNERRRERRLPLREPAVVRLCDEDSGKTPTVTENVSAGGVLLRSASPIPAGSKVEVTILLHTGAQTKGLGEVVRAEQKPAGGKSS